jgi:hypothetical protein
MYHKSMIGRRISNERQFDLRPHNHVTVHKNEQSLGWLLALVATITIAIIWGCLDAISSVIK